MKFLDNSLVKILKLILFVDIVVVVLVAIFGDSKVLVNTQFAFVSSLLISIASFYSFKKQVQLRSKDFVDINNQDDIDKIEDRFDLYSENDINEKELTAEEIKQILHEEKEKAKTNTIKNTVSSLPSYLSIYRVVGYVCLVVGFFYLLRQGLFDAVPYLCGLLIVPLASVASTMIIRNDMKEE